MGVDGREAMARPSTRPTLQFRRDHFVGIDCIAKPCTAGQFKVQPFTGS